MQKLAISMVGALVLATGVACSQRGAAITSPGVVTANRIVLKLEGQSFSGVSIQAQKVSFRDGRLSLAGDVVMTVNGRRLTADRAMIDTANVTLEGNARAVIPRRAR
jgi:lipopolysaccharide export system protein LptA